MLKSLKIILDVQELDMKMLRLMRVKKERETELQHIHSLRQDLQKQLVDKGLEIAELNKTISFQENRIVEIKDRLKKLEGKQASVKKVEEFNAITHEMSSTERERVSTEQLTSDLIDKRNMEEEILQKIKSSLAASEESSKKLESDIKENMRFINAEGREFKQQRDVLAKMADPEVFKIYERLLRNKKDRVVVPIENRTCSSCHIALTAQHENLVRKGERLVFCEHCSCILFWQESEDLEGSAIATKRRRRKATT
jgi:hypothetical protein